MSDGTFRFKYPFNGPDPVVYEASPGLLGIGVELINTETGQMLADGPGTAAVRTFAESLALLPNLHRLLDDACRL